MTDNMYENILGLLVEQNEILRELLEISKPKKSKMNGQYALWDEDQEQFLLEMYSEGFDLDQIRPLIKAKFDIERSAGALAARLRKLEVTLREQPPTITPLSERDYNEAPW